MKKCPKCGNEKEISQFYKNKNNKDNASAYCKKCYAKIQHDDYEYYKGLGLCVICKKDNAMIGSVICPECADKQANRDRARWKMLKNSIGYKEYRLRFLIYQNELHQRRRNAGICHVCGKHPAEKGHARCYECLIKRHKNRKRLDIPRHARPSYGLCYFCGEPALAEKRVCQEHYEIIVLNLKPNASPHHYWNKLNSLLFKGGKGD